MKYSKQLQIDIQELPQYLQTKCISYKKWKKYIKTIQNNNINDFIKLLDTECKLVDKVFANLYKKCILFNTFADKYKSILSLLCLSDSESNDYNTNTLIYTTQKHIHDSYTFYKINCKTMYKICKKSSKAFQDNRPLAWLSTTKTKRIYSFLGSEITKHIDIMDTQMKKQNNELLECPICFQEKDTKVNTPFLILPCGHCICLDCALRQARVSHKKGIWFNLLSYADHRECNCPLCRFPRAFQNTPNIKYI